MAARRAQPANKTYVVRISQRTDATGRPFCEFVNRWQYARPEEARRTASERGEGFEAVGLTPWQPAFDVAPIGGLKVAADFRDPNQKANETSMVRIFDLSAGRHARPVVHADVEFLQREPRVGGTAMSIRRVAIASR